MNYVNSQERIGIISHTIPERYDWANYTRDIFNPFKIVTSVNDDAVSVGVKSLCMYSSVSLILWLLSLVLVVVQRVENDHFSRIDALLFLPMWVGSVLGVTSSILIAVRVCSNATLVSRERRMFMRVQGTETENQFIDYESLPLMRQLFCWTLVLGLFFTFSLIAQILFYFWYIDASIGLWDALIPVCVLVAVYLIYLYSVEVFSILSCVVFSLITLELILYVLKSNHQIDLTWTIITIPILAVQAFSYGKLVFILYKIFKKEYLLQNYQQVSLILYILALLLSSDAEFIKIKEDISHSTQHSKGPMVLWAVAIVLIVTGSLIILNAWGNEMAESRGYVEPIPLSRTSEGWVPSSHKHYTHSTLLGKIVLREPNLSLLVDNARNGSSLESVIIHPFGRHVPNNGRSSISPTASKSKDSGGNRRHRKSEIEMASLETYNV